MTDHLQGGGELICCHSIAYIWSAQYCCTLLYYTVSVSSTLPLSVYLSAFLANTTYSFNQSLLSQISLYVFLLNSRPTLPFRQFTGRGRELPQVFRQGAEISLDPAFAVSFLQLVSMSSCYRSCDSGTRQYISAVYSIFHAKLE